MADPLAQRRATALAATTAAARVVAIDATGAAVIRDANNTIVLLPRERLVGKVATSTLAGRGGDGLEREVRVGMHLAARGSPIARPAAAGVAGPHRLRDGMVTFWEYHQTAPEPVDGPILVGHALHDVHADLADVDAPLPSLQERLEVAADLFADQNATPGLSADDRRAAASAHGRIDALLQAGGRAIPLHGEPHGDNVLWTTDGPLLVDFEAVCIGPVAWDLAYLPEAALVAFPDADTVSYLDTARGLLTRHDPKQFLFFTRTPNGRHAGQEFLAELDWSGGVRGFVGPTVHAAGSLRVA